VLAFTVPFSAGLIQDLQIEFYPSAPVKTWAAPRVETLYVERMERGWNEKCGFMFSLCNSLPGWP